MKPESVNLMTSARHELGSFISNEEDKKYWKSRSHGVGWAINTNFGITQIRKTGIEQKTELLAKNKWMRNSWKFRKVDDK